MAQGERVARGKGLLPRSPAAGDQQEEQGEKCEGKVTRAAAVTTRRTDGGWRAAAMPGRGPPAGGRVVIAAAFSAAAMKRGPGAGKTWAGRKIPLK